MGGEDLAPLLAAGSNLGGLALVLVVVLRRPPAVATLDTSVRDWIERLELGLDRAERRENARLMNDPIHRAWDTDVLLAMVMAKDLEDLRQRVQTLGNPPSLTPHPSTYLEPEELRRMARRAAAPVAPDVAGAR